MPTPAYSICITNYNTVHTIRKSLDSLLNQLDDSFEVIVCDNLSTDGSNAILKEYALHEKVKLIEEKSNRGQGRQIAYEHSCAPLIISGLDLDDTFKPMLREILRTYHAEHEGFMWSLSTFHIIPRAIIEEVHGWRNLPYYEDVDFSRRVERIGKLHYCADPTAIIWSKGTATGLFRRTREAWAKSQAAYQISSINQIISINFKYQFDFTTNAVDQCWYKRLVLRAVEFCAILTCKLRGIRKLNYLKKDSALESV